MRTRSESNSDDVKAFFNPKFALIFQKLPANWCISFTAQILYCADGKAGFGNDRPDPAATKSEHETQSLRRRNWLELRACQPR